MRHENGNCTVAGGFCNAVNDPTCEALHNAYDCGYHSAVIWEHEERRWIPVTERLPEDDLPKDSKVKQIKVFVAYKTNGRWVERTQIRVKGYWYSEPDKWSWVKTSDPISHWMPLLPEPPKENAE